jgi:F420-non-reducing hydrogenase iron-sulfur subunit
MGSKDFEMCNNFIKIDEVGRSCHSNTEQWTIDGMPQMIRDAGASMGPGPNVIALACRWRYFAAGDLDGLKRLASNVDYRLVLTPCCGQMDANWVATALNSGAEAVLVMGGHPANCSFSDDPAQGETNLRSLIKKLGVDPERLVVDWSVGENTTKFQGSVDRLMAAVESSGPQAK